MAQRDENIVSMVKEVHVRQVNKRGRDDGGTSTNTTEQTSKVSITVDDEETNRASSKEEKLRKLRDLLPPPPPPPASNSATNGQEVILKPKIQRVPFMLQDHKNFDKYYVPRVAANGPFHHGKPKYEQAEAIKRQLAANFLKDSDQNISDLALLQKIEAKIKELREWYEVEATKEHDDESLAWMLFVDGCSTLEFIYKYEHLQELQIKRDQVAFAEQDLFLLENQLPYQLLKLLLENSRKRKELEKEIHRFVEMHGVIPDPNEQQSSCLATIISCNGQKPTEDATINIENEDPTHLLDLLRTKMLGPPEKKGVGDANKKKTKSQSFRNVQELQAAGIHFKRSKGKSLRDIKFKRCFYFCGFLSLPRIKVDDFMGPKFMNLIAYEMCPDFQNDFGVTSYIAFMDSLIDHADDVKHLRKKKILHNLLGCDEEVTKIFNEIGTDLVPNKEIYEGVKSDIESHYKSKVTTWMAQVFHDHFSSPWTFLAFIGVLFGLWMSAVQTWYTVYSNNPPPCVACK